MRNSHKKRRRSSSLRRSLRLEIIEPRLLLHGDDYSPSVPTTEVETSVETEMPAEMASMTEDHDHTDHDHSTEDTDHDHSTEDTDHDHSTEHDHSDHDHSTSTNHDHSALTEVADPDNAPQISITAINDFQGNVEVAVDLSNFLIVETDSTTPIDGEGHLHIYLDGVKVSRFYGTEYILEDVEPGTHNVEVSVNAHDHSAYSLHGEAISASATLNVYEDSGLTSTQSLTAEGVTGLVTSGGSEDDEIGAAVKSAGDVNGDGIEDLIVGAPGTNDSAGAAYLVYGAPDITSDIDLSALSAEQGLLLNGSAGERAGETVNSAGDINGDGFDDLLVGAPLADPTDREDAGSVYVVFGGNDLGASLDLASLDGTNGFRLNGAAASSMAGGSVAGLGDFNGDGIDDFVVGAAGTDADAGTAYVVYGASSFSSTVELSGLSGTSGFHLAGSLAGDELGFSVEAAGDTNADGINDLIVGAPGFDVGSEVDAGAAYVVFGTDSSPTSIDVSALSGTDGFRLDGVDQDDRAGTAVAGDGDANGDGIDDVIVGSPRAEVDGVSIGAAYVVLGSSSARAGSISLDALDGVVGFRIAGDYQSDPLLSSFIINLSGQTAHEVPGQNTDLVEDALVNFTSVVPDATSVYATSSGISYQIIGPFPGNPGTVTDQDRTHIIPRTPTEETGDKTATTLGSTGVWIDGVAIYNWSDGQSYNNQGVWDQNAVYFEGNGLDANGGHPPPTGEYHTHTVNIGLMTDLGDDGSGHSPILGWSYDGFPIYGPWGYENADGSGDIVKLDSSWTTRDITARTHLADGTDVADGPSIEETPLGAYVQDHEYIEGLGDLDEYNGRFSVTPEYPEGIYHYVVTIDDTEVISVGAGVFPYVIGLEYYGEVETDNLAGGGGDGGPGGGPPGGGPPGGGAPADDGGAPADDGGAPADDGGAPADDGGGAPPEDGGAPPEDGGAPPEDGGAPPEDGGAPPEDGGAPPEDGGAPPEDGGAPPEDGGAPPEGGGAPPEGGGAPPEDGGAPPEGGGAPPEDGGAPPEGDDAAPSIESVLPEGDHSDHDHSAEDDHSDHDHSAEDDHSTTAAHDHSALTEVADPDNAPQISITAINDFQGNVEVAVNLSNFLIVETDSTTPIDGEGHLHIYLDGVKVSRFYGTEYILEDVEPGTHTVEVSVNAHDHSTYSLHGEAITASVTLNVSEDFGLGNSQPLTAEGVTGLVASGGSEDDEIGAAVKSAGDVNGDGIEDLIVGAPGTNDSAGAAYLVYGSSDNTGDIDLSTLSAEQGLLLNGSAGERAGETVNSAGDINGDGFDDLLVGAPLADPTDREDAGSAYVVFGGNDLGASLDLASLDGANGFRLNGAAASSMAGGSVAGLGDFNGDGIDDFVVGAAGTDADAGTAYVVYGATSFPSTVELSSLTGTGGFHLAGSLAGDELGFSVEAAGDTNADGINDLIVGAPGFDVGSEVDAGAAYVVFGTDSSPSSIDVSALSGTDGFRLDGVDQDDRAGTAVAGDGDANGDGIDDVIVASPLAEVDGVSIGAAYVVLGSSSARAGTISLGELDGDIGFRIDGDYQSDPLLSSFIINLSGQTAHEVPGQNTDLVEDALVNFTSVVPDATSVYATSSGISYQIIGPFPGNPGTVTDQDRTHIIPRTPTEETGDKTATTLGSTGVWIDGVAIYNWSDGQSYNNQGVWDQNAVYFEGNGLDANGGHPPPTGEYHTHTVNIGLMTDLGDDGSGHSPILGWSYDGFPIYGPWGYENADGSGDIVKLDSSWTTRDITARTHLADGTDVADGPSIEETPLGAYVQDHEYVEGLGDLDEYNGRFSVTPEYPEGIYHYVVTIDDTEVISVGAGVFPYVIGLEYYGEVETDNLAGGGGDGGPGGPPGGGPPGGGGAPGDDDGVPIDDDDAVPDDAAGTGPDQGEISVSISGDFDGDGIDDIVVGDPDAYVPGFGVGGSVDIVPGDEDHGVEVDLNDSTGEDFNGSEGDHAGHAVDFADLNNDGAADVIVGSPGASNAAGSVAMLIGTITGTNDAAVIVTTNGEGTRVSESGTTDTLMILLASEPTFDVLINVSVTDTGEVSVDKNSLTFTPDNWNVAQVLTVTGVADGEVDGAQSVPVTFSVTSSDADYDALPSGSTLVTNLDIDALAGISLSETGGFTIVDENGSTDTVGVALTTQPTADVTITVNSSNINEATVAPNRLTFTPDNWDVAQTVTVTGVADGIVDADQSLTIVFDPASTDSRYNSLVNHVVFAGNENVDDQTSRALVIEQTDGTTSVSESGTSDIITVALSTEPTANVNVTIDTGDLTDVSASTTQLVFTPSNWQTPQVVTFTGTDDGVVDGAQTTLISLETSSQDAGYDSLAPSTFSLESRDLPYQAESTQVVVVDAVIAEHTIDASDTQTAYFFVAESDATLTVRPSGTGGNGTVRIVDQDSVAIDTISGGVTSATVAAGGRYAIIFLPSDVEQSFAVESNAATDSFTPSSPTNFLRSNDVNGDSFVTPLDALNVLNQVDRAAQGMSDSGSFMYDVNNDGDVDSLDALIVLNYINAHSWLGLRALATAPEGAEPIDQGQASQLALIEFTDETEDESDDAALDLLAADVYKSLNEGF